MKICVVGGGSAGWITASYLAKTTDCEITIVHTDEVEVIGVGESTTPTIQYVADKVGLKEDDWMRDGEATFKYGVEFHNWNNIGSRWFHTFDDLFPADVFHSPQQDLGKYSAKLGRTSVDYFLKEHDGLGNATAFNHMHGPMEKLLSEKLSPYNCHGKQTIAKYPGYSYHVNAHKFGLAMKAQCGESITEINEEVVDVKYNDDGVESIQLSGGRIIKADVYFDCSGFNKLLIGSMTGWNSYQDVIPNDRAIAGTAKNPTIFPISDMLKPCTQAHAQEDGWIWVIPTSNRIGSGFVYSSKYTSDDEAEARIVDFYKKRGITYEPVKRIKFDAGRLSEVAVKNVIANGLAQSFIEPLEATSLMVTCSTVRGFEELYNKHKIWSSQKSQVLSKFLHRLIDHNKKFVYYHYMLSERNDSQYWRDIARGHDPATAQEISDYADSFRKDRWCEQGETKFNRFNLISMMMGYNKRYTNELEDITPDEMEQYKCWVSHARTQQELLVKNNCTVDQWIRRIMNPNVKQYCNTTGKEM